MVRASCRRSLLSGNNRSACSDHARCVFCYGVACIPQISQGIDAAQGLLAAVSALRKDMANNWQARSGDWLNFCAEMATVLTKSENRFLAKQLSYYGAIALTFEQLDQYSKAGNFRSIQFDLREMRQGKYKEGNGPYQVRGLYDMGNAHYVGWFNSTITRFTPPSAWGSMASTNSTRPTWSRPTSLWPGLGRTLVQHTQTLGA